MKQERRRELAGIMRSAWNLARMGVRRFGGKPRWYFACALRMAWQDSRTRVVFRKGLGNAFWMPGVHLPEQNVKRGQFTLPGMI